MQISQLTLWHTLVAHADPVQVVNLAYLCGPTHIQKYVVKFEPGRYIVHTDHDNCLAIGFSIIAKQHVCPQCVEALFLAIGCCKSSLKPCLLSAQQTPFSTLT